MIIHSFRLTRGRLAGLVLLAGGLLCALVLLAGWHHSQQQVRLPDEAACRSYIQQLGYQTAGSADEIRTIVIPQWFDATYSDYNTRLKRAGFDLSPYRGEEVQYYTYSITNYPDSDEPSVLLHLLVWEDRLIGGDLASPTAGGFLRGLVPMTDLITGNPSAAQSTESLT